MSSEIAATMNRVANDDNSRDETNTESSSAIALSNDGPMGLLNVLFIQVVIGCANALPTNEYCVSVVAEMRRMGEDDDENRGDPNRSGYTRPWADFVQAVIDGKIDDPICREFFRGATVIALEQENQFDFKIQLQQIESLHDSEDSMFIVCERYGKVMQAMVAAENDATADK